MAMTALWRRLVRSVGCAGCACLAAGTAFAGNVCTWTGAGGDGKFSTAANWSVAPTSGNADLLYFPVGTADAVSAMTVENDLDGLSVAAIRTSGHNNSVFTLNGNAITLTGADTATCPEMPGSTVISNYTALVVNTPITVDRAGKNADMQFFGQKLTVNAKMEVKNVPTLYLRGRLACAYAAYIGDKETYPSDSQGSYFNAPFIAADSIVHERIGNNCGAQQVYFNAPVTVKQFILASSTCDSWPHLAATGNAIGKVTFVADRLYLDVDEALGPDTVLCDHRGSYGWMWQGNYIIKDGTHQTINRIEGDGDYLASSSKWFYLSTGSTGARAVVEMRGTADASTCMRVQDNISLDWNPAGNFKQTFKDRENTTAGEITVRRGTFAVAGSAVFSAVPFVSVLADATLEISSTNTVQPAFGALKALLLGSNARCVVGKGANPFAANKTMATLGAGAKFSVADGVEVKLATLVVNGARVAGGTYSADSGAVAWLEGEGSVTVADASATAGVTYWLSTVDGNWDDAANWSAGVPGATSNAVIYGVGSSTIQLSEASELPASLLVRNVEGSTTVRLAGERTWSPSSLTLNAGGRIEVPTGAAMTSDGATGTILVDGGEIAVTGGTLVYTNFQGSFAVQGTPATTGRVFVAGGTFQFSHRSRSDALRMKLYNCGELYATNGYVVTPITVYPFYQLGGRIVITGRAELRNGAAEKQEWLFGRGETVFSGDSVFRLMYSASRFNVTTYDAATTARVVFRDNAYFAGVAAEDPSIGSSAENAWSILEFDTAKPNTAQIGYRVNVGCDNQHGELVVKRGYVLTGYRGLNVGGSIGNQWNKEDAYSGAQGVLRMSGGTIRLMCNAAIAESAFVGFRLADGGPAHLARNLKGAFTGTAEVTGGAITNAGSTVVGGGRGVGAYTQTGGLFRHTSSAPAFIVGCAGGTGSWTLGGGSVDVAGHVYVGGVLTNQLADGYILDRGYSGNYPVDQHDAVGTLSVTGGTFACAKDLYLGCDGVGTLATAGATFDFTVRGTLVLSNTTVTASDDVAGWTTAAKLAFTFDDKDGIAPVKVSGKAVNTAGTSLKVDLGKYDGKTCRFPLIKAAAFEGADFADVEIVGDKASIAMLARRATSLDLVLQRGVVIFLR